METTTATTAGNRLYALDILRGLDMLLLTFVAIVIGAADRSFGLPGWLNAQFTHPWGGFTLYDLIMPLFIFISGAAVPPAIEKHRRAGGGRLGGAFCLHLAKRCALLWLLGMVAQGNLLTLAWTQFEFFSNTLQAIAVGYLATVAAVLMRRKAVWWMPAVLCLAYSLLLAAGGDYSMRGNVAIRIEQLFTDYRPQQIYSWYLTSMMFAAIAMAGAQATLLLRRATLAPLRRAAVLCLYGATLFLLGSLLLVWIPSIKQIYTASFTLRAVGVSAMLFAAVYALVDAGGMRRGLGIVELYGRCALTVYCVHELLYLLPGGMFANGFSELLTQGIGRHFGLAAQTFAAGLVSAAIPGLAAMLHRAAFSRKSAGHPPSLSDK